MKIKMGERECKNCYWSAVAVTANWDSVTVTTGEHYCTNDKFASICEYNSYYAWEPRYKCNSDVPWDCNYSIDDGKYCSGIKTCKHCAPVSCLKKKIQDKIQKMKEIFR